MADRIRRERTAAPRVRRPTGEAPRTYGHGVIASACDEDLRWLVVTVPEAWSLASGMLSRPPHAVHHVRTMDADRIAAQVEHLPEVDAVLGIGGGSAMDMAKYCAWKRELPLVLAPSTASADACLTETIGVRCGGRVRYIGEVNPQRVVVDFDLICAAPVALNRAGAADILSIHTALHDWRLSSSRERDIFHAGQAQRAAALIDKLMVHADDIRAGRPAGILTLMELFRGEVAICREARSSRPEEGSEHYWAYNAEYVTRRRFVHGELVALGIVMMSALQGNDPDGIRGKLDALGIRRRPAEIGITDDEVRQSLLTARTYVEEDRLAYSVLNEAMITSVMAEELLVAASRS